MANLYATGYRSLLSFPTHPLIQCVQAVFPSPLNAARAIGCASELGRFYGQGRIYGSAGLRPSDPCSQAPARHSAAPIGPSVQGASEGLGIRHCGQGRVYRSRGLHPPTDAPAGRLDWAKGVALSDPEERRQGGSEAV